MPGTPLSLSLARKDQPSKLTVRLAQVLQDLASLAKPSPTYVDQPTALPLLYALASLLTLGPHPSGTHPNPAAQVISSSSTTMVADATQH